MTTNVTHAVRAKDGTWTRSVIDSWEQQDDDHHCGLAFDPAGAPHITYQKNVDVEFPALYHAMLTTDGWKTERLDDLDSPGYTSMAIDSPGRSRSLTWRAEHSRLRRDPPRFT